VSQLRVDITRLGVTTIALGTWKNAATGKPLVEQFRVAGLGGNDTLGFVSGPNAVDVSALAARSTDWIGVLDGGPGNDNLSGSNSRDRLDGGIGSDTMFGFGGDDRLFGDNGNGNPTDHDIFFGGQGHDDMLAGKGTNEMYAWSIDPDLGRNVAVDGPSANFGVFVDADGNLHDDNGGGLFKLEDTGINRVLGSLNNDLLFGGTGIDFLYGNGGADKLFNQKGELFENADGGLAGDEWKAYARATNKV